MKATQIKTGTDSRQLILARGGIVNGCQTTKCIVEYATTLCYVPIKIVETTIDEAWNITKAANYQTAVPDIDLEIARSLRPQLLRRYGLVSSTEVEHGAKSALQLLDDLYQRKVTYDETRLLYIGLFSRSPNNLIAGNYTELHPELIRKFFEADPYGEAVFRVLLNLQTVSDSAKERVEKVFYDKKVFSRYYEADIPIYRCLVSLLALCGSIGTDLSDRVQVGSQRHNRGQSRLDVDEEYKRMQRFLAEAETILNEHPDTYIDYYVAAFNVWMREIGTSAEDEAEARQNMYSRTRSMSFSHAYSTLVDDVRTMRAMLSKQ